MGGVVREKSSHPVDVNRETAHENVLLGRAAAQRNLENNPARSSRRHGNAAFTISKEAKVMASNCGG
jgi:hypothetical protein